MQGIFLHRAARLQSKGSGARQATAEKAAAAKAAAEKAEVKEALEAALARELDAPWSSGEVDPEVLRIVAQGADAPEPTTLECIEGVYTDGVDCPSFVSPDVLREDGVRRLSRCDAHVACTALPVAEAFCQTRF